MALPACCRTRQHRSGSPYPDQRLASAPRIACLNRLPMIGREVTKPTTSAPSCTPGVRDGAIAKISLNETGGEKSLNPTDLQKGLTEQSHHAHAGYASHEQIMVLAAPTSA